MSACACGCGQEVNGTFARGHRLRLPGVASAVRAAKPPMAGAEHPSWRGGVRIKRGYRLLHRPDHPMADQYGYVLEHRLVMSEVLGRPLEPDEHVHHVNHDGLDNRPENLLIVTRAQHLKEHPRSRIPGWVKYPNGCIDCGRTDRRHAGGGQCATCYERERRRRIAESVSLGVG